MDPRKKSYSRFRYTQETLETALKAIIRGETSINKASKAYNIPKSTLHNKINNKVPWQRKMGPMSELSFEEENKLARWIINKAKVGFPMHPDEVYDSVKDFLDTNQRNSKFTDNRPGKKWLSLFLKRHPDVTKRHAELISKARAAVTEESLRKWFLELDQFLAEEDLLDIKEDPSRIFNADETGIMTCPKTGLILGPKNYKNTYEIANGAEKESITVLCTFAANGTDVPPFVVYPYKRMPPAVIQNFPDSWHIGRSDSGWMVSETFLSYIVLFYEWLVENNIKFPVLLFLDGHKSHINEKMLDFCSEKKIFLYCLHPNATHIIQPCDVGIFGPLKKSWKKVARKHKQTTTAPITKQNFSVKFKEAYDKSIKPGIVKNAFRTCGLFPIDPNAVDYSKCINTRRQEIDKEQSDMDLSIPDYEKDDLRSTMKVIENEVGHKIRNEFIQSYFINRDHEHQLYSLWSKCKLKLENRRQTMATPSADDIPLDLSNASSQNEVATSSTSDKQSHPSSPISPVALTITESAQIHVCPEENDFEAGPPVLSEPCSILLDDEILFENVIGSQFETTDEIVNFIMEKETTKSPIPLPWYDTFSQIAPDNNITNSCEVSCSTVQIDHQSEEIMTDTRQNANVIAIASPERPSILNSKDNGDLINTLIHVAAETSKTTCQEKDEPASALGGKSLDTSSASLSQTISNKRKVPIESFLSYPEIQTKKKRIIIKEPMPFGLTGRKYKEYLENRDKEKKQKEEDIQNKKKVREAIIQRRRESQKEKKDLQKKDSTPLQKQHKKKKETAQKSQNEDIDMHSSTPVLRGNQPPLNIICGKYVIVQFKTEKRTRCFVGKILMIDDEKQKMKIDFLRKKKVVENVISFVKPQVPDISEVNISDIVRVLDEPSCSRRGMISFSDVSFKDIE